MGYRQAVRHRTLTPACAGSNPASPVKISVSSTLYFLYPFLGKEMVKVSQYIITDGERFIYCNHSGKFVPTSSEAMADIYTKKQAEGICKNSLPRALKSIFYVEKYDRPPESVKQVSQRDLKNNTEKVMVTENIQVWLDKIDDMNGLVRDAKKRKEILEKQLHELEDEKLDIEHYIEFQNLNASQGYKASKELKTCRVKRRSVKNELAVIDIILELQMKEIVSSKIYQKIEELDKRTYKPRVREDLFDL